MRVRIVGVPNLAGMTKSERPSTEAVFRHLCGTYKRVTGFDSYGCAELYFAIRRGRHRGLHSVAIEPALLAIPTPSKSKGSQPPKVK
jgi:hypothetical protein